MAKKSRTELCPCGSGLAYDACCGRFHAGEAAPTPEALMRSRYAAYALGLEDHLLATWAPETAPSRIFEEDEVPLKWVSLTVFEATETGDAGEVRFEALARSSRGAVRLRERSRFRKEAGRWLYVDGDVED